MSQEYVLVKLPNSEFVLLWVTPNPNKRDLVVSGMLETCGEDTRWVKAFSNECLLTPELAVYFYRVNSPSFFGMFSPKRMHLKVGDIISKTDQKFKSQVSF